MRNVIECLLRNWHLLPENGFEVLFAVLIGVISSDDLIPREKKGLDSYFMCLVIWFEVINGVIVD